MRKALLLILTATLLGFVGTAMAQGPWNFSGTAANNVIVAIPTVLAMHITGTTSGATTDTNVVLSPSASDIANASTGSTFSTNTGGFTGLIAFTNAKNGATITTTTTDSNTSSTAAGVGSSANVLASLYITEAGTGYTAQALNGQASFFVPRGGQQKILDASSFSLVLYPSPFSTPAAGYTYLITYTMTAKQ